MSRVRTLRADVNAYLRHIEAVRNLSPHTLRAYEGDLDKVVGTLWLRDALAALARGEGAGLIIALDCGTGNFSRRR